MIEDPGDLATAGVTGLDPDTLQLQRDTMRWERYALGRWLGFSPASVRVDWRASDQASGGGPTPADQPVPGNQQDPFHGVCVLNPSSYPVGLAFEVGSPALPLFTVPARSWLCVPTRYTNLNVRLMAPTASGALDSTTAAIVTATVLRLRIPPLGVSAGPLGQADSGAYGYAAGVAPATVDVPATARVKRVSVIAGAAPATITIAGGPTITVPTGASFSENVPGDAPAGADVVIGGTVASYYVSWLS